MPGFETAAFTCGQVESTSIFADSTTTGWKGNLIYIMPFS